MIVDPKSHVPIYKQIVDQLRDAIGAGIYKPGEILPSLRALAIEIQVNPNTVQRAYDELEREGAIRSRRGVGVFVEDRESLSARSVAERKVFEDLARVVGGALEVDLRPERIRSLFEDALAGALRAAKGARTP